MEGVRSFPRQISNLVQLLMHPPRGLGRDLPCLLCGTVSQGVDSYHLFSVLHSVEKMLLLNSDSFAPDLSQSWKTEVFFFPLHRHQVMKIVEL